MTTTGSVYLRSWQDTSTLIHTVEVMVNDRHVGALTLTPIEFVVWQMGLAKGLAIAAPETRASGSTGEVAP